METVFAHYDTTLLAQTIFQQYTCRRRHPAIRDNIFTRHS